MSLEVNSPAICPRCQSGDCLYQIDEQKVQCSGCGEVFIHPVLIDELEEAA